MRERVCQGYSVAKIPSSTVLKGVVEADEWSSITESPLFSQGLNTRALMAQDEIDTSMCSNTGFAFTKEYLLLL